MKTIIFVLVIMMSPSMAGAGSGFTLVSTDLEGQLSAAQVLNGFGCTGENRSPQLHWQNAPEGTKSFAVTVYDPDAPTGSGWWHWLIFDIPKEINELKRDSGNRGGQIAPKGSIQSTTSFGTAGYGGACPPPGDPAHGYIFTVHALDVEKLGLKDGATPALVGFVIGQHTLAKASLLSYFAR